MLATLNYNIATCKPAREMPYRSVIACTHIFEQNVLDQVWWRSCGVEHSEGEKQKQTIFWHVSRHVSVLITEYVSLSILQSCAINLCNTDTEPIIISHDLLWVTLLRSARNLNNAMLFLLLGEILKAYDCPAQQVHRGIELFVFYFNLRE